MLVSARLKQYRPTLHFRSPCWTPVVIATKMWHSLTSALEQNFSQMHSSSFGDAYKTDKQTDRQRANLISPITMQKIIKKAIPKIHSFKAHSVETVEYTRLQQIMHSYQALNYLLSQILLLTSGNACLPELKFPCKPKRPKTGNYVQQKRLKVTRQGQQSHNNPAHCSFLQQTLCWQCRCSPPYHSQCSHLHSHRTTHHCHHHCLCHC